MIPAGSCMLNATACRPAPRWTVAEPPATSTAPALRAVPDPQTPASTATIANLPRCELDAIEADTAEAAHQVPQSTQIRHIRRRVPLVDSVTWQKQLPSTSRAPN